MLNLKDFDSIFVFQYGRVGSHTIVAALKPHHDNVIHTHTNITINPRFKDHTKLIITVSRNFYDRQISAFFLKICSSDPDDKDFGYCSKEDLEKTQVDLNMMKFFRKGNINFLKNRLGKGAFFTNFYHCLGANLLSEPFNHIKKYRIDNIPEKNLVILSLRFEDLYLWSYILSNIFNKDIRVPKKNLTSRKQKIPELMEKFKRYYKFSPEEIDLIEKSDTMTYFYTDQENEYFKNKYS